MKYGPPHTITIIEEDGELTWEVEHSSECIKQPYVDEFFKTQGHYYDCGVQHELDNVGLDAFGDTPAPGTYKVRSWSDYDSFNHEYDGGLELID